MKQNKEKVYITRDEGDNHIFIWRKPHKGNFSPEKLKGCEMVNWQRVDSMDELDSYSVYLVEDFKKKFGFVIREKAKKSMKIEKRLLDNQDYQLFSNNLKRKK